MVSKKWLGALVALVAATGACSSGEPNAPEATGSTSAKQVATIGCTPLATGTPFLSCGALSSTNVALATQVQTQLSAQMQTMFASVSLVPDFTANTVAITSPDAAFGTFFGPQIVAPLTTAGVFTAAIPFAVGDIAPGFNLVANIWGAIPVWNSPLWTGGAMPALNTSLFTPAPLLPGFGATGFANTSAAFNSSAANTAAFSAATMPLSLWISTPLDGTFPLACNGAMPLGCL